MSVILTARDSSTLTFNLVSVDKDGPTFVAAESTSTENWKLRVRHSESSQKGRHNVRLELRYWDADLRTWLPLDADLTLSADKRKAWSGDQIEDVLTMVASYVASEAEALQFNNGLVKT